MFCRRDGTNLLSDPEAILVAAAARYTQTTAPHAVTADETLPWHPDHPDQQGDKTLHPCDLVPPVVPSLFRDSAAGLLHRNLFDRVLHKLSERTAAGPDGLPNELLKFAPQTFKRALFELFQQCWKLGEIPSSWKESITTLLYKANDPTVLKNYRPVGLLRTIYKLFSAVMTEMLTSYTEWPGALTDSQEGGRPARNCKRQLQLFHAIISDAKLHGLNLEVLWIDFANAFGFTSHCRFRQVLKLAGIPEDAIKLIMSMYTGSPHG